jgi:thiamine kinase-like enzyme
MPNEDLTNIAKLASLMLRQQGIDVLVKVEQVTGGRNNRAFRVMGSDSSWLLKQYFQGSQGMRDRCATEWDWSQFCWQRGVTWGPEPLERDEKHHATLFEFIEGRRLQKDEVNDSHVEQAAQFVAEVNLHRGHPLATSLPVAAEACFSYEDHVACVDRRINRLTALPVTSAIDKQLQDWLQSSLVPAWGQIVETLRSAVDPEDYQTTMLRSEHCLSPSDFGFHNALITSTGRIRFFDFEYAGWDDPAKLICDFFWQQDLPAPRESMHRLVEVLSAPDTRFELKNRVKLLFPLFGAKWCCLLLNEFVREDRLRREFAQSTRISESGRAHQLELAKQLLLTIND